MSATDGVRAGVGADCGREAQPPSNATHTEATTTIERARGRISEKRTRLSFSSLARLRRQLRRMRAPVRRQGRGGVGGRRGEGRSFGGPRPQGRSRLVARDGPALGAAAGGGTQVITAGGAEAQ